MAPRIRRAFLSLPPHLHGWKKSDLDFLTCHCQAEPVFFTLWFLFEWPCSWPRVCNLRAVWGWSVGRMFWSSAEMDPRGTMTYQPPCDCCQNAFLFSKVFCPLLFCFAVLGDCSSGLLGNKICCFKEMHLFALVGDLREGMFPCSLPNLLVTPPQLELQWLAHHLTKHWF